MAGRLMPRIRTIKPEFWTDGDVVELSAYARLLFIGSWNFALCDRGHVADDAKRLKMQILPADDVDPIALLDEILSHGRMDRIEAPDGRTYLHIRRFTDHQKIEKRWNPRCPACDSLGLNDSPATSSNLPEPRARLEENRRTSPILPESPTTSDQEGKGREGKEKSDAAQKRGQRLPEGWNPDREVIDQMRREFPGVDLQAEHAKFTDYWQAKAGRDAVKLDWNATWRNWIRSARPGAPAQLPAPSRPWTPEPPPADIADDPEACDRWYRDQQARRSA